MKTIKKKILNCRPIPDQNNTDLGLYDDLHGSILTYIL